MVMEVAEALERLEDEGFVVLESLISATRAAELDALARRAVVDCPATAEGTASWEGGYSSLEGAINRMPELAELVDHPLLLEIAAGALKTEAFEQYNGVALKWCRPGCGAGALHADWPQNQTEPPWPETCPMLQSFWCLTPYTAANGATMCVPFSHHTRRGPSRDDYSHHEIPILCPAGSVVLFVSGMWHRQGANTSEDEHRMAANIAYTPTYWTRGSASTLPCRSN